MLELGTPIGKIRPEKDVLKKVGESNDFMRWPRSQHTWALLIRKSIEGKNCKEKEKEEKADRTRGDFGYARYMNEGYVIELEEFLKFFIKNIYQETFINNTKKKEILIF